MESASGGSQNTSSGSARGGHSNSISSSTVSGGRPQLFRNVFILLDTQFSYSLLDNFCKSVSSQKTLEILNALILLLDDHYLELLKQYVRLNHSHQLDLSLNDDASFYSYKNVINRMVSNYLKLHSSTTVESFINAQIQILTPTIQQYCLNTNPAMLSGRGTNNNNNQNNNQTGQDGQQQQQVYGSSGDEQLVHIAIELMQFICIGGGGGTSYQQEIFSPQSIQLFTIVYHELSSLIGQSFAIDLIKRIIFTKLICPILAGLRQTNTYLSPLTQKVYIELSKIINDIIADTNLQQQLIIQQQQQQQPQTPKSSRGSQIPLQPNSTPLTSSSSPTQQPLSTSLLNITQQINDFILSLINRSNGNLPLSDLKSSLSKDEAYAYFTHYLKTESSQLDEFFKKNRDTQEYGERNYYMFGVFKELLNNLKNFTVSGGGGGIMQHGIYRPPNNIPSSSAAISLMYGGGGAGGSGGGSGSSGNSGGGIGGGSGSKISSSAKHHEGTTAKNVIDWHKKWNIDDLKPVYNGKSQKKRAQIFEKKVSKSINVTLHIHVETGAVIQKAFSLPSTLTLKAFMTKLFTDSELSSDIGQLASKDYGDYEFSIRYGPNVIVINNHDSEPLHRILASQNSQNQLVQSQLKQSSSSSSLTSSQSSLSASQTSLTSSQTLSSSQTQSPALTSLNNAAQTNNEILCEMDLPLWNYDLDADSVLILRREKKRQQQPFSIYLKCLFPTIVNQTLPYSIGGGTASASPVTNLKTIIMLVSLQLTPHIIINEILLKHVIELDPTRLGFLLYNIEEGSTSSQITQTQLGNDKVLASIKIATMDVLECNFRQAYELSSVVEGKNISLLLEQDLTVDQAIVNLVNLTNNCLSTPSNNGTLTLRNNNPASSYCLATISQYNRLVAYLPPQTRLLQYTFNMNDELVIMVKNLVTPVDRVLQCDKDTLVGANPRSSRVVNASPFSKPAPLFGNIEELEGVKYRYKITWVGPSYKTLDITQLSIQTPLGGVSGIGLINGGQSVNNNAGGGSGSGLSMNGSNSMTPMATNSPLLFSPSSVGINHFNLTQFEKRYSIYYSNSLTLDPSLVSSSRSPICINNDVKLCVVGDESLDKVTFFNMLRKSSTRNFITPALNTLLNLNSNQQSQQSNQQPNQQQSSQSNQQSSSLQNQNMGGGSGSNLGNPMGNNSVGLNSNNNINNSSNINNQMNIQSPNPSSSSTSDNILDQQPEGGIKVSEWSWAPSEAPDQAVTYKMFYYSGQDIYQSTHPLFVSPQSLFILTYPLHQLNESTIEHWLEIIQTKSPGSLVYIIGLSNTDDKSRFQFINPEKLLKYSCIVEHIQLNLKNSKQIRSLLISLHATAKQKQYRQKTPIPYILLRNQLIETAKESKRAGKLPITTLSKVRSIALTLGMEFKQVDESLRYLYKCGDILMFKNEGSDNAILPELVFLDILWLSKLVSSVFTLKHQNGMLLMDKIHDAWEPLFLKNHHSSLLYILEQFGIMHSEGTEESQIIVPSLFGEDRPNVMTALWPSDFPVHPANGSNGHIPDGGNIQYERVYQFQYLPKGFFSRLSVRMLQHFDAICIWQNGMVIQSQGQMWAASARNDHGQAFLEYNSLNYELKIIVRDNNSEHGKVLLKSIIDILKSFIMWYFPGRLKQILVLCTHCIATKVFRPTTFTLDYCEKQASFGNDVLHCNATQLKLSHLAFDVTVHSSRKFSVIPFEDLQFGPNLGSGSFAVVYRGLWNHNEVAIKKLILDDDDATEKFREFRHEAEITGDLQHENIVSLKGVTLNPFCIITELLSFGDLCHFLSNTTEALSWKMIMKLAMDIAKGMNFLHSCKPMIIHRDLKSANILLGGNSIDTLVAKVSDFGLSVRQIDKEVKGRKVWNWRWLAPEIIKNVQYTEKIDIYSYAVVVWEIITRDMPFDEFFDELKWNSIIEDKIINGLRPTIPSDVPEALASIIRDCWQTDPQKRPSFEEIINRLSAINMNIFDSAISGNSKQNKTVPASTGGTIKPSTSFISPDNFVLPKISTSTVATTTTTNNITPSMSIGGLIPSPRLSLLQPSHSGSPLIPDVDEPPEITSSPRSINPNSIGLRTPNSSSGSLSSSTSSFGAPTTSLVPKFPFLNNSNSVNSIERDPPPPSTINSNNSSNGASGFANDQIITFSQFLTTQVQSNINCLYYYHQKVADFSQMWCGCNDGSVIVINIFTKSIISSYRYPDASRIIGIISVKKEIKTKAATTPIMNSDAFDEQIWVYYSDGILIYDPKQPSKPIKTIKANYISCLADDGQLMISNCREKVLSLKIYSKNKYKCKKTVPIKIQSTNEIQISSIAIIHGLASSKVWIGTEKGGIYLLDYTTYNVLMQATEAHHGTIHTIKKVDNYIWTVSEKQIIVYDEQLKVKKRIDTMGNKIQSILNHDQYVYAACWENSVLVYDRTTYACVQKVQQHTCPVSSVAIVNNTELWASGMKKISTYVINNDLDINQLISNAPNTVFTNNLINN